MVVRTRPVAVLVALVLIVGAAVPALASPNSSSSVTAIGPDGVLESNETLSSVAPADRHPSDPAEDVLGWEDGYWYNETIDVTPDDGLNESELEAVVARGMARVEEIRRLEFEEVPPVEVISRAEYEGDVRNGTANLTDAERLHQNVKYEALLMVNESIDATDTQADNRAGGVAGFYAPSSGEIKIVSANGTTPKMNEITLAQELFHALQDQHFDTAYNQSTRELHNAKDGILEGDGNYVDHLYEERCGNEWSGTCVTPSDDSQGGSDFQPHLGLYQILFQPYSDGPPFVEAIRKEGGWDAVNAVYEDPPASTEQTIHPEKYREDEPSNVSVPDRSGDDWRVLEMDNGINYASFGEAGLYVMLWYPSVELARDGVVTGGVVPYNDHINFGPNGEVDTFDPYDYDHRYTAGWDGDKLVPYVTNESVETNETGYVYRTVWDSPDEAAEFREGYEELLALRDAEPVEGHLGTYRIPDDEAFGDAFYVERSDATLTIVNAPSVSELSAVYAGAAPEGERTDVTTTGGDGFTALVAMIVILGLLALRRH